MGSFIYVFICPNQNFLDQYKINLWIYYDWIATIGLINKSHYLDPNFQIIVQGKHKSLKTPPLSSSFFLNWEYLFPKKSYLILSYENWFYWGFFSKNRLIHFVCPFLLSLLYLDGGKIHFLLYWALRSGWD